MHLLDDDLTQELKRDNLSHSSILSAEIVDNSYFNANIHPPLMSFEIKTPNGNTALANHQQLPVNELEVQFIDDTLQLFYAKTNQLVKTFDLSFQSLQGRSELFKLLNNFSPAQFIPLHYIQDAINNLVVLQLKKVFKFCLELPLKKT